MPLRIACLVVLLCGSLGSAHALETQLRGEAAAAVTVNDVEPRAVQLNARYVPELFVAGDRESGPGLAALVSVNLDASTRIVSRNDTESDSDADLYRAWLRFSTSRFEARAGRQKITFGSATLLRPLRWFDQIDPRDPLQITEGVDALLLRYYFLNNANVWLWGLLGNDAPKGWELIASAKDDPEYGGRLQVPAGPGEVAASYHHRVADASAVLPPGFEPAVPEDRYALDGKWDATVGLWFEAALIHQQSDLLENRYRRLAVLGVDYTFGLGDGLTVLGEHFIADSAQEAFGSGDGSATTALSVRYRWGVVDELSAIFYHDWRQDEQYSTGSWRRTYDHWAFNLLVFANPEGSALTAGEPRSELLSGNGAQILVSFNH